MDNQNNPNWPNNLNPTTPAPVPNGSIPTPSLPTLPTSNPFPDGGVTQPIPVQPVPATPQPAPIQSEPVPTFTQQLPTSPLDNPWGTPTQQTPAQPTPQSTWVPPTSPANNINPIDQTLSPSSGSPTPPAPQTPNLESAPTDLSHLISANPSQPESVKTDNNQPLSTVPETLVVSPQAAGPTAEVPTLPTQNHKGIPKWLIGVGAGLLIIVIGASAYFILGVGQPTKTSSVPAEVSKPTVKAPPPIATPVPQASAPVASGSANFGQLQGSGATASPQATSAADLLKRQQGR